MASDLKLTMTCGPYDRAQALIDGSIQPKGIELAVTVNADDIDRQRKATRGEYDVIEFFTGTYIADLPHRKLGFTAIPIYVKRMFRHSYIYVNRKSGIKKPTDLNGKRVGVQNWATSAAVWAKGILEEEYGVDLASITWVQGRPMQLHGWAAPKWLKMEEATGGSDQFELLAAGKVDAAITTEVWAPDVHPDIDFLFPDYGAEERAYYKKTRCFPIMHTLLVRTSILEANPWVARSLFDAWEASKKKCLERQQWERMHLTSLWYRALWEEERAAAGEDIYQWGFKGSRHELERLLRYCHRQALIPQLYKPEDMFWPSMLET
jgi:4,5-dihydroxyphthalate decarboxylase